MAYNTWYENLYLFPSLNSWVLTLAMPLLYLYYKTRITGYFPAEYKYFVHLIPSALLAGGYVTALHLSVVPDRMVYHWSEFSYVYPVWWMFFRIVCCLLSLVQLFCYLALLKKLSPVSGRQFRLVALFQKKRTLALCIMTVLAMNILTSTYMCLVFCNLLYALLSLYVFRQSSLFRTVMHRFRVFAFPGIVPLPGISSLTKVKNKRYEEKIISFTPDVVAKIRQVLDEPELLHERNVTMAKVADEIGIKKYMLKNYLKYQLNTTLAKYLREKKLDLADKLLKETDRKIADVAFDSGFESEKQFYSAFRERHGKTPSDWRKVHRGC